MFYTQYFETASELWRYICSVSKRELSALCVAQKLNIHRGRFRSLNIDNVLREIARICSDQCFAYHPVYYIDDNGLMRCFTTAKYCIVKRSMSFERESVVSSTWPT